jgi:DNA-binding NarL/FixJ family response regulator
MTEPSRGERSWASGQEDREILARLAEGETIDVIARHVRMSERTIRRRLRAMADVIGVETTIEVVVFAVRQGLI